MNMQRTPLMLTAGKVKEEEEENSRKDEALMTGLTDVSLAIQAQTNELAKLCTTLDQKEQELLTKSTISTQIASTLAEQVRSRCSRTAANIYSPPPHSLTNLMMCWQSTNQAFAELKAEISTLKALLLSKNESRSVETKQSSTTGSAQTVTTSSPSSASQSAMTTVTATISPKPQPPVISKAEKMETTLKLIRTQVHLDRRTLLLFSGN